MGKGGETVSSGAAHGIPDFRRSEVALKYVKRGYTVLCRHLLTLVLIPVAASVTAELANLYKTGELRRIWEVARQTDLQFNLVTAIVCCLALAFVSATYLFSGSRPVYLVDFHCYKPPHYLKANYADFDKGSSDSGAFDENALNFQRKVLERSGLGEETYLPPVLIASIGRQLPVKLFPSLKMIDPKRGTPALSMKAGREEAEMVLFSSVKRLLESTGLKPSQIDILIVNCSLFNPTPSLSAMVINHFKMRSNIHSYNLAGMGCSAGVIAINLAKELLQVYPNSNALVVSTENITQNWYFGNDKSMLIPNCLFRLGGAAMLMTNKRKDRWRAKYELVHTVRTHMGADDGHYNCVIQREDDSGQVGVYLSRHLMAIAGHALKANITTLGPLVLPFSEQLLFFFNLVARKVLRMKLRPYIPDFKLAFEHFCLHTGGRGVIEAIEQQLKLTEAQVAPSKETLYRYGNTSSSSIWYVLANIESLRGVRRGDRVWQIAFGSGFKCNSAVWRALRTNHATHLAWSDKEPEPDYFYPSVQTEQ